MPDRPLDPEAEARIREACPYHAGWTRYREQCWWCDRLRAAILADREARETKLRCEAVMCSGCDAILDVTLMHATVDGDVGAFITQTEPGKMPDERAHADALAEALRGMDELAGSCAAALLVAAMHGEAGTPEVRALNTKRRDACKAALAAHDKRRGVEVRRG